MNTSADPTTPETVRGLLEPGGELHGLVNTALLYPQEAPELLAPHVADRLDGKPERYVEAVKVALMEIWKAEKDVAA